MSEIKILHLSDLHYDSSKPKDTEIILNALWKDLDNFRDIDFILFSGDLVKSGDKKEDFEKAFQVFIVPLLEKTKLNIGDFFIAPGNHDIQRSKIDNYLEEGLKAKLKDRESLNKFLDEEKMNGYEHIERIDHFNDFKTRFNTEYTITSNKLFSTHFIKKKNIKIGIACLNTVWRATGRGSQEKGQLLIGERQIDDTASAIKDCDIKIGLYHHSLDWLTEYDLGDAKRRLSKEFDLLFCGHLHDSNLELVQNFNNSSALIQGGSINSGRSFYNGYSVLCLNVQKSEGTIYLRSYFDDRRAFDKAINKCECGEMPVNIKKQKFDKKVFIKGALLDDYEPEKGKINVKLGKVGRDVIIGKKIAIDTKIEFDNLIENEIYLDLENIEEKGDKITLPLSYDFMFSPMDEKGNEITISSISIRDTKTIIYVPGNAWRGKLKVIKPEDRSGYDGQRTSSSVSENDPGDNNVPGERFFDWLNVKAKEMDDPTRNAVQNAKREIIIRKDKYYQISPPYALRGIEQKNENNENIQQEKINQFYRYTRVDCPQECFLNDEIELSIQLTIKKPLKTAVRQLVGIPVFNLEESIKLELKVTAPDFQIDKQGKAMNVPLNDDSETVTFKMKPLSIGSHLVEVAIYFNTLRIGYFGLEIQVKDVKDHIHPDNPADIVSYENPGDYIDHAFLPQSTIGNIKVDRFLHVDWIEDSGNERSKLYFTLYPEAEYWEKENVGTKEEIIALLTNIASDITDIARKKYKNKEDELACLENMRGFGQYLFEKIIPEGLRNKVENWPSEKVLCISTNESWIPWELLDDGNGFWGERFLLFRIPRIKRDLLISEQRKSIPGNLPTTNKINNILHVIGGEIETLFTEKAKEVFKAAENHASVITLEQRNFLDLMKQSGEADLLHFTCHGYTNPSYLQISGKTDKQLNLTIMSMKRKTFLIKNGSIVFSNACHSSSSDVIFGDFTNFGWEFYRKGTALFIGTIGTIPTEYAIEFSGNFYKWLLQSNVGAANAFREAKREMNKKNNFFHLLYCLYANPILVK
jgi:predicted phosphodiesterase